MFISKDSQIDIRSQNSQYSVLEEIIFTNFIYFVIQESWTRTETDFGGIFFW